MMMKLSVSSSCLLLALSSNNWNAVEAKVRGGATKPKRSLSAPFSSGGLTPVMGYGAQAHLDWTVLNECEGDCDSDSHCAGELVCCQRGNFDYAPGCSGGEGFQAKTDFCANPRLIPDGYCNGKGQSVVLPAVVAPVEPVPVEPVETPAPSESPTTLSENPLIPLEFVANTMGLPLGLCQGDCDIDDDCLDDFVCFQRDMFEKVPGCAGMGEASVDYCTRDFSGSASIITPAPTPAPQTLPMDVTPNPLLPQLTIVGDDLGLPLGLCEGDCDSDADCLDNLVCFQRDMLDPVPGCNGLGRISYDYCILGGGASIPEVLSLVPEVITMAPSIQPPILEVNPLQPPLTFIGDWNFFVLGQPLGMCEGDCDSDDDCLDSLVCFQRQGSNSAVPFCSGTGQPGVDYCTVGFGGSVSLAPLPAVTRPPHLQGLQLPMLEEVGDDLQMPLGVCQGDCDTDDDCLDELVCFQRDLLDPVPGCLGNGHITYDYCIIRPDATLAPNTPPTLPPVMRPTLPVLATLETVYGDRLGEVTRLGLCQGDCDTDDDCLDELVCFLRVALEPVPGCGGMGSISYDYCVKPVGATMAPTWAPNNLGIPPSTPGQNLPMLEEVYDSWGVGGLQDPLGLCQGDCDTDADCVDELICYQREVTEPVPGCAGMGRRSYDYCIQNPLLPAPVPTAPFQVNPSLAIGVLVVVPLNAQQMSQAPHGLCEGECDSDADCLDELICFQRLLDEPVPGCTGVPRRSYDYCVHDPFNPPAEALPPLPPLPASLPSSQLAFVSDTPPFMSLGLCQGDCDTDDDCAEDFVCFQRDLDEPVPGCVGDAWTSYDYCIRYPYPTSGVINGAFCNEVRVVGFCNDFAPDGTVCASEGQFQAYCSYGIGEKVCAFCATQAPPPTPPPTIPPVPVTAQPVSAQPVTAAPVTAAPITAPPISAPPVQVIVVVETTVPVPPPTDQTVVSSTFEEPMPVLGTLLALKSVKKNTAGLGVCQGPCSEVGCLGADATCHIPSGGGSVPGCNGSPGLVGGGKSMKDGVGFCTTNNAVARATGNKRRHNRGRREKVIRGKRHGKKN